MKILLISIFIFICFVIGSNAQLCSTYTTTLIVENEAGKTIEDTQIKIVSLQKDDINESKFVRDKLDASRFSISFNEGYKVRGNYKIIVSANGFATTERDIRFPHCEDQEFNFKLPKSDLVNQATLRGILYDVNGAIFPFTKIEFKDASGKTIQIKSNDKGEFTAKLPLGVFVVSSEAEVDSLLYKNKEIKVDVTDFDDKKQNLTLYCTDGGKGRCPTITTYYCN